MTSHILRERLVANIRAAVHQAQVVNSMDHDLSKGTFREIAVQNLLRPLLRSDVGLTSGIVVDSWGQQSRQIDVIVYSTTILPPLMVESALSYVPAEACIQAFEIKSKLTATELRKTVWAARSLQSLNHLLPGPSNALESITNQRAQMPCRIPTVFSILAFDTDLALGGKSELDRLNEVIAAEVGSQPGALIHDLCVIGRGFWTVFGNYPPVHRDATDGYDEVIEQLLRACDSWPVWLGTRGMVPLRPYFSDNPFGGD
jgi:hypothetical protein